MIYKHDGSFNTSKQICVQMVLHICRGHPVITMYYCRRIYLIRTTSKERILWQWLEVVFIRNNSYRHFYRFIDFSTWEFTLSSLPNSKKYYLYMTPNASIKDNLRVWQDKRYPRLHILL